MSDPSTQAHDYEIVRHQEDDYATRSRMSDAHGQAIMVGLERPWVDLDGNGKRDEGVSRFVPGLYRCFLRISHLNGGDGRHSEDVWQFENAPDVKAAQLHIANFPWDLEGCVATGTAFGDVEYKGKTVADDRYPRETGQSYPGVSGSGTAFKKFMKDSLDLCTREQRTPPYIWIRVTDAFAPVVAGHSKPDENQA